MAVAEDDVLRHLLDAALLRPTHDVPIHSFQVQYPPFRLAFPLTPVPYPRRRALPSYSTA